ncbi:MAG TPA: UDP-N-acetylmuramoyl-L-alanyl-D-glutamate--2,6-diaminopimelate ligase [Candidatus Saccharimonadales bacterium]|nr:UDP-N-acetylmuramoyl-L-alanyl-D-glutamate--2,6-diaminopimelate ligase [Candidatus Saccharimonadales bacterium]
MYKVKQFIKQLIPNNARQPIANAYHFLVAVAANVRYGFPARSAQVIMVTGTNGKTTTVTMIGEMLASAGHKVGINSTAFVRIGDEVRPKASSRTLEDMFQLHALFAEMKQAGCKYIVLEATSMGLVQHRLWGVPVDVAVMTNLTQDHLDYHGTMERYAAAKALLFKRRPKLIVLNRDDEWFDYFNRFEASEKKVTYGSSSEATCRILGADMGQQGSMVTLKFENTHELTIRTHLPGKFNVYNAAAAASVGWYLQLEPDQIATGIANLQTVPGRMERIEEGQRFAVVVDYAHTPDALQNALETLRHLTKGRLWVVFGATGDRDKTKRPIMGEIAARLADCVIVTDEEPYSEEPATIRAAVIEGVKAANGEAKLTEIADRKEAITKALTEARPRDIVVITGMGHETVRNVGGQKLPWNDAEVAREVLRQKKV